MFSLLFGKRKKDTGTGYGGSVVTDVRDLKRGRDKAAAAKKQRDATTLSYLIHSAKSLRNQTLADTNELANVLKDVFRNQVPQDWNKQKKLLVLSLTCLGLLVRNNNYSEILGDANDSESLAAAFHEFAQHAQFLNTHQHGNEHAQLVAKILQLESRIVGASNNGILREATTPTDAIDDAPTHLYRKTLSPLLFDFSDSLQGHYFSTKPQSNKLNIRTLFQELSTFKSSLPLEYGSSIFVRAVEGRLDLLRALIIGPEDTPYANGCFLFDIWLDDYPTKPPKVQFLTTGKGRVTFNPNLYKNGKVCLSLLGTWDGPGWIKGESTLLQVLVSIQSLIFVNEPIYNEPLAGMMRGLRILENKSQTYNANIRRHVLHHAILPFIHGSCEYPEFHHVMQQHYRIKRQHILNQVGQWMQDDVTLTSLAEQVSIKLSRRSKLDKVRRVKDDGDDDEQVRKKQKTKSAALLTWTMNPSYVYR